MAEVFIDGKRFEYDGENRLLQYMLDHGLEVPFFCYHPSLSVPANCRQCMVKIGQKMKNADTGDYELNENGEHEIRWFPKLQTACNIQVTDGMVVQTQETDALVQRAQKDNLEMILLNHPLDCPICDQAGECPLQIQTYKYGPEGSRFEVNKVHKPKRIQLGPRVILDAERCINCTRCVRFTDEISKTHQLTITRRGDKNYPTTAPGNTFNDSYSLNTVDICPVGALTSADFRFKARVWEMNQTPSIDITNGKGTNIDIWTRDNLVMRITPRYNKDVNDHWMPDAGREAYKLFNENRVSRPSIKLDGESSVKTSWNNAVATLSEQFDLVNKDEVLFIGSPHASVEENYLLSKLANLKGAPAPLFVPHIVDGAGDGLLLTDDQAPNTEGCRMVGMDESNASFVKKAVSAKKIKLVIILTDHLIDRGIISADDLEGKFTVMFATNNSDTTATADLVVPVTCVAEHTASYINVDSRIQRTIPAKETLYSKRNLNLEMNEGRLDRFGTSFDNWVTQDNKVDCMPLWDFLTQYSQKTGHSISFSTGREVFADLSENISAFKGLSYEKMDDESGVQITAKTTTVTS